MKWDDDAQLLGESPPPSSAKDILKKPIASAAIDSDGDGENDENGSVSASDTEEATPPPKHSRIFVPYSSGLVILMGKLPEKKKTKN